MASGAPQAQITAGGQTKVRRGEICVAVVCGVMLAPELADPVAKSEGPEKHLSGACDQDGGPV